MALLSAITKAVDELVQLGYPREVAERIVDGKLDMRTDAIIERQQDMFPTTAFHGGGDDIRVVDPNRVTSGKTANTGFFMSSSPVNAASYADRAGNIMPLAVDTRGFDVVNAGGNEWNRIVNPDYFLGGERLATFGELPGYRGTMEPDRGIFDLNVIRDFDTDELARTARRFKSPGLIVKDVQDIGPNYKAFDPAFEAMTGLKLGDEGYQKALDRFSADTIVASDPTRVRSLFAAFDPEYKGSNILGGAATAAVGAGLLAAPGEAEAGFVTKGGRDLLEAYHGSPYVFDRFSLDAIGTGEGAQAFGHGLYFADREVVAKDYRDALTRPRIQFAGKDIDTPYTYDIITEFKPKIDEAYDDFAQGWVDEYGEAAAELEIDYDPDALAEFVELVKTGQEIPTSVNKGVPNLDEYGIDANELFDRYQDIEDEFVSNLANISQIQILDDIDYVRENSINNLGIFEEYIEPELAMSKNEGALYRVEIDTRPDQLLDYDKPLSEQPQAVQDAMRKAMQSAEDRGMSQQLAQRQALADLAKGEMTGQQAYESLSEVMHPFMGERGDVMASQALKDQGLLGIRYDDRISRNRNPDKVEGTSNYVIFDDAAINIAERGAADPRLLALIAGGSGAGVLGLANESVADTAARLRAESDTSGAYAPRSGLLQNVTMAARDLERRLEGSPASLLFPSGYIQHLEEFNRPYERSTYMGALLGALDFL